MARKTSQQRQNKKKIFIWGEDTNDCEALRELCLAIRNDIHPIPVRTPISLKRTADTKKQFGRKKLITKYIEMNSANGNECVALIHRDLDQVESEDPKKNSLHDEREHLKSTCDSSTKCQYIATSPAWEMEAWWFMWPDQIGKIQTGWKRLRPRTGRVDLIHDAKKTLQRELRPNGKSAIVPDYAESDSVLIARRIREDNAIHARSGSAEAFDRLIQTIKDIPK